MTLTLETPLPRSYSEWRSKSLPIVLATDGTNGAAGAVRIARALAERDNVEVRVVACIDPASLAVSDLAPDAVPGALIEVMHDVLARRVRDQLASCGDARWPVQIGREQPAMRIARTAHDLNASLIVLGIGRHRPVDRLLGTETALQVARLADLPVLVVPEDATGLPRHAVVGTDFSSTSTQALRSAVRLIEPGGQVTLVHAIPQASEPDGAFAPMRSLLHERALERFDDQLAAVKPDRKVNVHRVLADGTAGEEVLALAERADADLVACGSHGYGFFRRMMLGSVSTTLVRAGQRMTLIVPPSAEGDPALRPVSRPEWSSFFDAFSERNEGRITTVELDDRELGAQRLEMSLAFRGATFDRHSGEIQLVLGADTVGGTHLSHRVQQPERVDVIAAPGERESLLRIAYGTSQVLLRFDE